MFQALVGYGNFGTMSLIFLVKSYGRLVWKSRRTSPAAFCIVFILLFYHTFLALEVHFYLKDHTV